MNPNDLVAELGGRLNLTGLTLNGGVCRLIFDHSLPIDLEDDGSGNLCFHTVLGPLPHDGREAAMAALMSAHLFGLQTDGAVLGLHPETHELYLFRTLPADTLDVETAYTALERFTQQAESWQQRLQSLARDVAPHLAEESSPMTTEALRA